MRSLLLLPVLFLYCTVYAQDVNPFESIGKPGKVVTLSKGKYMEVHPYDSLQRIGSVIMNMNTGQIHKFLDRDSLYATEALDPTIISRWYSVDPLIKAHESPYSGMSNNPIWFTDPNGADTTRNEKGELTWEVEKGDTYWRVGEKLKEYGLTDKNLYEQIESWNDQEAHSLQVGSILRISQKKGDNVSLRNEGTLSVDWYIPYPQEFKVEGDWVDGGGVGIDFTVDPSDETNTYNWVQTIESNLAEYNGFGNMNYSIIEAQYTDPRQAGDPAHTYYFKDINKSHLIFHDLPRRPSHPDASVFWTAELSLVRKTTEGFIRVKSFRYGFRLLSNGTLLVNPLLETESTSKYHEGVINNIPTE